MHDDDLGPDIYWKGYADGYRAAYHELFPGATTPSEQKGTTEVLPTSDHSAESVPPGAQVAPVRGTPCQ